MIVVEGKYDKIKLESLVDGLILTTDGFRIFKDKQKRDVYKRQVFMLADGVMPANEGRGYVLKRLLRRAARHGRLLGIHEPFLYQVVSTVVKENEAAYPELKEKQSFLEKIIKIEEENFNKTIGKGFEILNQIMEEMQNGGRCV